MITFKNLRQLDPEPEPTGPTLDELSKSLNEALTQLKEMNQKLEFTNNENSLLKTKLETLETEKAESEKAGETQEPTEKEPVELIKLRQDYENMNRQMREQGILNELSTKINGLQNINKIMPREFLEAHIRANYDLKYDTEKRQVYTEKDNKVLTLDDILAYYQSENKRTSKH